MKSLLYDAPRNGEVYTRQIAFFAAFLLPTSKFLEAPAILSRYAKGDVLLPALLHFLVQTLLLLGVLYALSKSKKSLFERLYERLGKWIYLPLSLFAAYFLFASLLPLLDLEKFVYAAFFDTAPTTFGFGFFFILLGFVCSKGIKSLGRCADLCLFLFLFPFCALIIMGLFETDFTRLLPFFGTNAKGISQAFVRTTPHFSDVVLLLPLLFTHKYEEGDGVKITLGYAAGAVMTLLFFAVFFGIFSTISSREHYAFAKIAQYFPALDIIGRFDLIFVYLLSAVLLFYTCTPALYATDLIARMTGTKRKSLYATIVSVAFFVLILFINRYYNAVYQFIGEKLAPVFWLIADLLPLCCLFLKENPHAQRTR